VSVTGSGLSRFHYGESKVRSKIPTDGIPVSGRPCFDEGLIK